MNDILMDVPFNTSKTFITAVSPISNCQFYVPIKEGASDAFIEHQKQKLKDKLESIDSFHYKD
jgi:hypothetical protein